MGEKTTIEWTHHTFNPWIGCTKVHAGCTHCYAETLATTRLRRKWGKGAARAVTSESNWKQPLRWARAAAKAGERRRVFCASLADVLDEEAPPEAQARLWQLIRETAYMGGDGRGRFVPFTPTLPDLEMQIGGLTWLLLTKRPERWELIPADVRPLVWLGMSVSDQETWDEWVDRLAAAKGFARLFVSLEPMLRPVDMGLKRKQVTDPNEDAPDGARVGCLVRVGNSWEPRFRPDWVIVGGESGSKARPCAIEWIRSIVEQCRAASVPCFVKQLGARAWETVPSLMGAMGDHLMERRFRDKKGGDISEWPEDLRVRQFPGETRA